MADDRSLFERRGRSALTEGAARFDTLAKELKTQQVTEIQGIPSTAYQAPAVSPDEEWARNFMTQGIGPRLEMPRMTGFSPPLQMPNVSMDFAPSPAVAPKIVAPSLGNESAIGGRLGKPAPQRSWLGRLLRPKTQGAE